MRNLPNKLLAVTRAYYTAAAKPPPPRNLLQEGRQQLQAAQETAPYYLALNNQLQPGYTKLGLYDAALTQNGYYDDNGKYQPGSVALGQQANTSNRGAALTDLNSFGPGATAGILRANPYLGDALTLQNNAARAAGGPMPLLNLLTSQAQRGLQSNGALSPQEGRDLSQAATSGFAARGVPNGNSSMVADLFSRDSAVRARQQQAQQFASGVQGLTQQQQQLAGNLAGNAASTASGTLTNPFLQMLGLGNLNPGYSGSGAAPGGSAIANAGNLFQPNSGYASDLFNTNYNAQASSNIANASAQNNQNNALIGLFGHLLLGG